MLLPHWLERFFKDRNRKLRKRRNRVESVWDSPSLGVMRLEKRRVLNAAPVPVDPTIVAPEPGAASNQSLVLEVDASQSANDNQADVFKVSRQEDRIEVFANGALVASELASKVDRIEVFGSDDADTLILDFAGGSPLVADGIVFHAGSNSEGNADRLVLQNGGAETITHLVGPSGAGEISIDGSHVSYVGAETVVDSLAAADRYFTLVEDGAAYTFDDAPGEHLSSVQVGATSIVFAAPRSHLTANLESSPTSSGQTVEFAALDSQFNSGLTVLGDAVDTVNFTGTIDFGSGNLSVTAGVIGIQGAMTTAGGRVDLLASTSLTISDSASITSHGGAIVADAGSIGSLSVSGRVDVSDTVSGHQGGTVHLLGQRVGLLDSARVDASGDAGGGTILIGGGAHGADTSVHNSVHTSVDAGVVIRADAVSNGDGGTIVVWSDDSAVVAGELTARGGAFSGDGGFIETSGKRTIDFAGATVGAGAVHGKAGRWLIDPTNVTIGPVQAAAIVNSINVLNTSVVVTTNLGGADTGVIMVNSAIDTTPGVPGLELAFEAADDVIVNAQITAAGANGLNVRIQANNDGVASSGTGDVQINAPIITNGGTFASSGRNYISPTGPITTAGGNVSIVHTGTVGSIGVITAAAGTVRISGSGDVSVNVVTAGALGIRQNSAVAGNISASTSSDIGFFAASNNFATGSIFQVGAGSINVANVSASGGFANTSGVTTNNGAITLLPGGILTITNAINAGSGTIDLGAGEINDGNASNDVADVITTGALSLSGDNGIGANVNGSLDVDVGTLTNALIAGSNGNLSLNLLDPNNSGVTVTAITGAFVSGNVSVESTDGGDGSGTFTFDSVSTTNGTVSLSAAEGNITARNISTATTAGRSISITVSQADHLFTHDSGAISSDDGAITLSADNMTLSGGTIGSDAADVRLRPTDAAQNVRIGTGAADNGTNLGLTTAELDIITTAATHSIVVGQSTITGTVSVVGALNFGVKNLSLATGNTTAGAITDGTAGAGGNLITGTNLTFQAAGGIDVRTTATVVAAASTTAGDIRIDETDAVTVGTFHGITGISTTASDVTLIAGSTITLVSPITAGSGGTVTVTATAGQINDGNAANNVADIITTGNASLSAVSGIGVNANGSVDLDVGTLVFAGTTTGGLVLNLLDPNNSGVTVTDAESTSSGDITFEGTTGAGLRSFGTVEATDGDVTISAAAGNIALGDITSDSGVVGTHGVDVTATTGGITLTGTVMSDNDVLLTAGTTINDDASDNVADIVSQVVSLTAATGIGTTNGSVDVDVNTVTLATSVTGGVSLNVLDPNNSDVTATLISATTLGNIVVESTEGGNGNGTFTFETVTAANGTISLSTTEGDIRARAISTTGTSGRSIGITVMQANARLIHDSGAIASDDGVITLSADNMTLSGGTITSDAANVRLRPTDPGQNVRIGTGAADNNANLGLTTTELDIITTAATHSIVVGQSTVSSIIDIVGAVNLGVKNLSLETGNLTAGAITDGNAGAGGNLITGTNLTFLAAGGIDVSTSATLIAAASTTAGDIRIDETNAVTVGTFNGIAGISTTASDVTLIAGDTITLASPITAGSGGTIIVTSTAGQINDGNPVNGVADITTTGAASLSAATGIGVLNGLLDLDVGTLTSATSQTDIIGLNLLDPDNGGVLVSLADATVSGNITIDATVGTGTFTFTTVDTNDGDIALRAFFGNIILGTITSDSGVVGTHTIASATPNGSITISNLLTSDTSVFLSAGTTINDDASDNAADIVAASVSLFAGTGIGTTNGSVDVDVPTVTVATSATGGVNLNLLDPNNSGVTATAITATTSGNIVVESTEGGDGSGTFLFTTVTAANGTINLSATEGHITAQDISTAGTSGRSIDITVSQADHVLTHDSGSIVSDDGAITLSADNITLSGGTIASDAADVRLRPTDPGQNVRVGTGATDDATNLGLTPTELNTITTAATNAIVVGQNNISGTISVVGALNLTGKNLSLETGNATAGAITDGTAGAGGNLITGVNLTFQAAGGIDVSTTATLLAAQANEGNIYIHNTGGTSIGTFHGLTGVEILDSVNNNTGHNITVRAASPLTVNSAVVNNDGGNIILAAEGATGADDLAINANVTAAGGNGNISLFAGDTISQAAATVSAAGSGAVLVSAGTNYNDGTLANGTAAGNISMADGAIVQSEDGIITLQSPGDLALGRVNANSDGDGTDGDVTVTADFGGPLGGLSDNSGAISDASAAEGAGNENIVGHTVTLNAATGIGSGASIGLATDIDIAAGLLEATNTTSGTINVFAVGTIEIVSVTNATRQIVLESTGSILDNDPPDESVIHFTADTLTLVAATGVGNGTAPNNEDLDLVVSNLSARTDSGDIHLQNTGALTIGTFGGVTGVQIVDTANDNSGNDHITVRAASPLTVNSDVLNQDGGNIVLAAEGNLTTDDLTLAASVTALGGNGNVNLYAGGDLLQTSGSVTAANAGNVLATAGEDFNDGTPAAGFANADVTMFDGTLMRSATGTITVRATDDVLLAQLVVASGGTVTVTADANTFGLADAAGAISDNTAGEGIGNVNISAGAIILSAATGIGSGAAVDLATDIDIAGGTLTAGNNTSGTINIFAAGSIAIVSVSNATRQVVLDSSGAITDSTPLVDAAVNFTADTLTLRALSGIGDGVPSDLADIDLSVSNLAAQTDAGDIHLQNTGALVIGTFGGVTGVQIVDSVDDNSGTDQITVRAASPLTVNSAVVNNDAAGIRLAAEGNTAADDLTLNANVTVTGGVGAIDGEGEIELYAGDTISLALATVVVSTNLSGTVLLSAGTNYNDGSPVDGTSAGDVLMVSGSMVSSEDGNITVRAPNDVSLSILNANSNADGVLGDVIVTADYQGPVASPDPGNLYASNNVGQIIDNLAAESANITGDQVALRAAGGIGDGVASNVADIDLAVNTVAAVTEHGDIHLQNTGALAIDSFDGLFGVTITDTDPAFSLDSTLDHITIRASSPLTVALGNPVVNNDGGNIVLAAEGVLAADDLSLFDNVTVTGGDIDIDGDGNIELYAGESIILALGSVVVSVDASGTVLLSAGTNYNDGSPVDGNSVGDVTMISGSTIRSEDGNITVLAPNDIFLSILNANGDADAVLGDVIVTADYAGPVSPGTYGSNNVGRIADNLVGESANIIGDQIALRAGSGIGAGVASDVSDIDLAVNAVAAVTEHGNIHLQNTGALSIDTFDGLFGVTITDTDAAFSLDSTLDNITIRTSGVLTIAVGNPVVNNDGGNVVLAAEGTTAADDLTLNANVTVTGGDGATDGDGNIELYAGDTVNLALAAVVVSTNASGTVLVSAGTNYNDNSPVDGNSAGDVLMTSGSAIRSEDGNITVLAPNDVFLSILDANSDADATLGDVIVTADYAGPVSPGTYGSNDIGRIIDNLAGEAANIIGNRAALRAGSGIGDGVASNTADIDVQLNTLAAVTEHGDTHIQDLAGGLTIDTFDGLSGVTITDTNAAFSLDSTLDHITIRASSPLTVALGNPVVNNDGGNIVLAAEGTLAADDLTLNANVTVTGGDGTIDGDGNIELYAGDTIDLALAAVVVSTSASGTVLLSAGTNYNDNSPVDGSSTGDVTMTSGSTVSSEDGPITVLAPDNVLLSILDANSNADGVLGNVIVTADYGGPVNPGTYLSDNVGQIVDNLVAETANIIGDHAALRAGSGIGDGVASNTDDIDVNLITVAAVTEHGDIHIQDLAGGLIIDTFDGLSGVTITDVDAAFTLNSTLDHITIRASGALMVSSDVVNNDGGNIVLAAEGTTAADDLTLNDNVTVTGGDGVIDGDGNIELYAGDTIDLVLTDVTVSTNASGTVLVSAGTNYNDNSPVDGNSAGDVMMTSGSAIRSEDGNITVRAPNDVFLSILDANSNGDGSLGDVIVTADFGGPVNPGTYASNNIGRIIDNLAGEAANIIGDQAALRAGSGIGDGVAPDTADIDVQLITLVAVTEHGDIHIQDLAGGLSINGFDGLVGVTITDTDPAFTLDSAQDNITIRASSVLLVTVGNPIVNNDGGNIVLAAEGTTVIDDLILNSNVTVTGGDGAIDGDGNIELYAGDTVNLAVAAVIVSTNLSGTVLVSAGTNYNDGSPVDGNSTGDVGMISASAVRTEDGNITVLAPNNVVLSILDANSNGDGILGDVIVTADFAGPVNPGTYGSNDVGAIIDNLVGEGANIIGDQAALRAGSGIGDGVAPNISDIDIAVNTVAAVTEHGDIHLQDLAGGLTIDTFDGLSGVTITDTNAAFSLNSTLDHITIRASSPLTVALANPVVNNDGGNIVLAAEGTLAADDLTLNANVTVTGGDGAIDGDGNIELYAGDTVNLAQAGVAVATNATGTVLVSAGTNYNDNSPVDGNSAGDVQMTSGSAIRSEDGNITVLAPNNVFLSILDANSDADGVLGDVIVTADFGGPVNPGTYASNNIGRIIDNLAGEAANITGDQAALRAGSGIGDGIAPDINDIDVKLNLLAAVTESGDIHVQDPEAGLTIGGFDNLFGITITDAADNNSATDFITVDVTGPLVVNAAVRNFDGGLKLADPVDPIQPAPDQPAVRQPAAISLTANGATDGDLTINGTGSTSSLPDGTFPGEILATGGDGRVVLIAQHNMTLNETGKEEDISVTGDGKVIIDVAGNLNSLQKVEFDQVLSPQNSFLVSDSFIISSGHGQITGAPPALRVVDPVNLTPSAPQNEVNVGTDGVATVIVEFGRMNEQHFIITTNWGDGITSIVEVSQPTGGNLTFTLTITGPSGEVLMTDDLQAALSSSLSLAVPWNLNAANFDQGTSKTDMLTMSASNATGTVSIIHQFDQLWALTRPDPGTPISMLVTLEHDRDIDISFLGSTQNQISQAAQLFVSGLGAPQELFQLLEQQTMVFVRNDPLMMPNLQAPPQAIVATAQITNVEGEESTQAEDKIVIQLVKPDNSTPADQQKEYRPQDILRGNTLEETLKSLPDGRYRVILLRKDGSQRQVIDVFVRNGKLVNALEEDAETPDSSPQNQQQPGPAPEGAALLEQFENPLPAVKATTVGDAGAARAGAVTTTSEDNDDQQNQATADANVLRGASVGMAAGMIAALRQRRRHVQNTVEAETPARSRAAQLYRRLRRNSEFRNTPSID